MKTNIEDILGELRDMSERIAELPLSQRRGHNLVRQRDEMIRAALKLGIRPVYIRNETGLNRNRIYQIRDAEEQRQEDLTQVNAVTDGQLYPLAVGQPLPRGTDPAHYRVRWTGEFRRPRPGEWFLSGAVIEGYWTKYGENRDRHIAELVPGHTGFVPD